ncbi:hypothetical protein ACFL58_01470 [Elusimicrobiota bacterium]
MFIFPVVVAAAVLVTLGYLALWSSAHEKTSKGLAGFGRVMAIILFVLAGLAFLMGTTYCVSGKGKGMCGKMMMHHKMDSKDKMGVMKKKMMKWQKESPKEFGMCMKDMNIK